jgi:hypothetical protein
VSGRDGAGSWRSICTEKEQHHRPDWCDTVAERIRVPDVEACQLPSAVATFATPLEYASFEFPRHHGATVVFAWFHHVRRLSADHDSDGVS